MATNDDYERRFMGADEVLFRERVRMAWWGHLLHLVAFAMALHAFFLSGAWLGLLVVPFAWLVLMTLRVAVSRSDVHVQLGVFGPRIPLADIESVDALPGGGVLGWRARMTFGPVYSVPSSARGLVRITYLKSGHRRSVRFSSRDPARMVRAIESARAGGRARIAHVAAVPPQGAYARELAEAEAEVEEMLGTRVDPLTRRASG